MLVEYNKGRKRYAQLATWATGKGMPDMANEFTMQSNQNWKLELETMGKLLSARSGSSADRLLPWVRALKSEFGELTAKGSIITTPGLESMSDWAERRFYQHIMRMGGADISPDQKFNAMNQTKYEATLYKKNIQATMNGISNYKSEITTDAQLEGILDFMKRLDPEGYGEYQVGHLRKAFASPI